VDASLYFHIPLCTKKCAYCHFYVIPDKPLFQEMLYRGLLMEWERQKKLFEGRQIVSLYFGGGTPALLPSPLLKSLIQRILEETDTHPEIEITLEANPENLDSTRASQFLEAGIKRLSIGIQSLDPDLLPTLERSHSASKAIEAVHAAYSAGVQNISVDLMYDLPDQSLESWVRTCRQAAALPIRHLSRYNLTIEPHTSFAKHEARLRPRMPDEDLSTAMYQEAQRILSAQGLAQYEISAFARDGQISRHNSGYWTGRPFLGLGPSAFSYWEGARFRNACSIHRWYRAVESGESAIDFEERLDPDAARRERLIIALRRLEGVDLASFERELGPLEEATRLSLEELRQHQLLHCQEGRWRLSDDGILLYDALAAQLV
jgi:oxygen-independent coproporphyrinogen-3 oxidase